MTIEHPKSLSPILIVSVVALSVSVVHVALCPYTKVEESFNLQAAHDVLEHGPRQRDQWDHQNFPGVVPRSFFGAFAISSFLAPLHYVLRTGVKWPLLASQLLFRTGLAGFGILGLNQVARAAESSLGTGVGVLFLCLCTSQFHLLFYLSRPLPNIFALALVLQGTAAWMRKQNSAATAWISAALVIFRCDIAVFAVPLGVYWLWKGELSLWRGVAVGCSTAVIALLVSVPLDSFLWGRLIWPELEVFLFNFVENGAQNSAAWGTHPVHWYFSSALPRALTVSYPISLLGAAYAPRARPFVLVALASVCLYSILPHKELRFIFPAIPLLNLGAAATLAKFLFASEAPKRPSMLRAVKPLFCMGVLFGSALLTSVFSLAAVHNYPGGRAFDCLHRLQLSSEEQLSQEIGRDCANFGPISLTPIAYEDVPLRKSVHIGVAAAQQGVSLFGEEFRQRGWLYSKEEDLSGEAYQQFDYLLMSEAEALEGFGDKNWQSNFRLLRRVRAFAGLNYREILRSFGMCLIPRSIAGKPSACVRLGASERDILILERIRK